jgi:hypothetical protein
MACLTASELSIVRINMTQLCVLVVLALGPTWKIIFRLGYYTDC